MQPFFQAFISFSVAAGSTAVRISADSAAAGAAKVTTFPSNSDADDALLRALGAPDPDPEEVLLLEKFEFDKSRNFKLTTIHSFIIISKQIITLINSTHNCVYSCGWLWSVGPTQTFRGIISPFPKAKTTSIRPCTRSPVGVTL